MTQARRIEIITIYSASQTKSARNWLRIIAFASLLFAGGWSYWVHDTARPWLTDKLMVKGIDEFAAMMALMPSNQKASAEQATVLNDLRAQGKMRANLLPGMLLGWLGIAYAAGAWNGLGSLFGIIGFRFARAMLRQSALLILLSTVASMGGIGAAVKWGGMPDVPIQFYARIGVFQASFGLFLLVAVRPRRG